MKLWRFWERSRPVGSSPEGSRPDGSGEATTTVPDGPVGELARLLGLAPPIERSVSRGVLEPLPRPALRWIGPAGRIALREFQFDADADTVCNFQNDTYALNFPDFQFTRSFAQAFRHDLLRATLDSQHGLYVLDSRALNNGGLVGFVWLVVCENSWTSERYGYVNNVYVAPDWRGQNLGNELMRHSDDFFRSRGVRRVRLTVTAANQAAATLYARHNYNVTRWEMEKEL